MQTIKFDVFYRDVVACEYPDAFAPDVLSGSDQVAATYERFYSTVPDLLVLSIDPAVLGDRVVWEDLLGHGAFPHCYGPIPLAAVTDVRAYDPD